MKIKNILFVLITALLFSCSQKVEKERFQTIVLKKSQDILPISSFASKVDYIELKVKESDIDLGEIEDVKVIDDDLIVKHRMSGKSSFLRFTLDGEFVIELVGEKTSRIKEPKDLIAYEDGFAVLAENGIFLVSRTGKYSGELVNATMPGSRFFYSGGTFRVVNETLHGKVLRTYPDAGANQKKSEVWPNPVQRSSYASVQEFGKGTVHFYSTLNDTVFAFSNSQTEPVYALKGNQMPTFAQLCDTVGERNDTETLRYLRENEHVIVRKYLENKNYIFITYWVGSNSSTAIVTKKSGEIRYFGHGVNDLDGGVWDKAIRLSDKDELFVPITAYKVGGHKISNKKEKRFKALQQRIASSGNPVVMQVKLR